MYHYEVYRRNGTIVECGKGHGTLEQCQRWAESVLQCDLSAWSYKVYNRDGKCVFVRE